jgi:hypothetical protein
MNLEIVKYKQSHIQAVKDLNRRLREGGSHYQFPESNIPQYPEIEGRPIYQEYFLAIDEIGVHGGYILKHQDYTVKGEERAVCSLELPLSEGVIDGKYREVAGLMLDDCIRREPALYALGMGGFDQPVTRFLQKAGWKVYSIPFYFRIINPGNFLKNITYLRRGHLKPALLNVLAYSGLGWLGVKLHQAFISPKKKVGGMIESQVVADFGNWADELWNSRKENIYFSLTRDSRVLRLIYPPEKEDIIRLKVIVDGKSAGWVVLKATQLKDHNHFGNMKLGTIVDCLCLPGSEDAIISEATRCLEKQNVDLIISNQSHMDWCRALSSGGYLQGPSNFLLACSKELTAILDPLDKNIHRININRGNSGYWNF